MTLTYFSFRLTGWLLALILACITILSACSSSDDEKAPAIDDPGSAPTMPGNISALAHSSTEIELLWTPSVDDGLVIGYTIIRDGVVIKEQLLTSNFTDTILEPATTYQYRVVAVDDEGNDSIAANVEVTTHDGPPPPALISDDNHVDLLRHVFRIITGNAYFADIATLPNWSDPEYTGFLPWESVETSITCLNGGTARFIPFASGLFGTIEELEFEFEHCQDDTAVIDGQLLRKYGSNRGFTSTVSSEQLSIEAQSSSTHFSGTVSEGDFNFHSSRTASVALYRVSSVNENFELSEANTYIQPGYFRASMGGNFTVRSDNTGNRALYVSTIETFSMESPEGLSGLLWTYDSGKLELTTDDSSKLVLNADNGDPETVTIEIIDSNGVSVTRIQPWALWEDSLRFEFDITNTWFP